MENKEKNDMRFIEAMSYHMKRIAEMFSKGIVINDNKKIVEVGRTEEEKEKLLEMCEEIDNYHRNLEELRQSNLKTGEWLDNKIDDELEAANPEITDADKDTVKNLIIEQTMKEIAANADALSKEIDIVNHVMNDKEIAEEGGKE